MLNRPVCRLYICLFVFFHILSDLKNIMKWKLSLPESRMLVYYLVKLNGLAPFTVENNGFHLPTLSSKLYPFFVAASYLLFIMMSYTLTIGEFMTADHSPLMKMWVLIIYLMGFSCTVFTLVIFVLMHKNIVYLLSKLSIINKELKTLGIEMDHGKTFKDLLATTAMTYAVFIVAWVLLILMERDFHILHSIKYCIDSWFSLFIVLIFSQTLIYIRQRFTLVNETLYNLSKPPCCLEVPHHSRIFLTSLNTGETSRSDNGDLTDLQRIRKTQALHFELCDLVDRTIYLFNVPNILKIVRCCIELMTNSYRNFYFLQKLYQPCNDVGIVWINIVDIMCSIIRIGIVITEIFIIAHASATTCEQGNAVRAVLFKVWIKLRRAELTNDFFKFSHQLLHKPVVVSIFGIMALDYSFIFKIFSTVITYWFVVMQIEPPQSCM